ncbi:PhzF family phenazine biosynthesis protein [Alkalihalobacterium chitinilyticum]|uniref:PhzF family phenazine biosynthesis protein n=1 Tax=Alkalihalobacterium chitinilyticum TaxID=2980103 RepID=A0ABT5VJG6_9BACI|nr:PhzF family phenazine biosynthesis protein [Alkalihalobacterium chitinilyticum]MDE5415596.1 PhzF family phenazine biosynthesis protein [Alkalihalobacterium chitinilyticum]
MKEIQVYHVDAFTNEPFGGNPAGVVPDATQLTEDEMQKIARELNLSETAFLLPTEDEEVDYCVRFFTPTQEIDFCGHATLATAWTMATEHGWLERAHSILFKTNIGVVPIDFVKKGEELQSVIMTQATPEVKDIEMDIETISKLIGMSASEIDPSYPIKLAYTGNWHLLVPIKTRKAMDKAMPNMDLLKEHNITRGICTTHLFTFDSREADWKLYTRDFAPAVGITEDPVTGSANGALAGYLLLENILDKHTDHDFLIGQGDACGRPGQLHIKTTSNELGPVIQVGGNAVCTIRGTLRLR